MADPAAQMEQLTVNDKPKKEKKEKKEKKPKAEKPQQGGEVLSEFDQRPM